MSDNTKFEWQDEDIEVEQPEDVKAPPTQKTITAPAGAQPPPELEKGDRYQIREHLRYPPGSRVGDPTQAERGWVISGPRAKVRTTHSRANAEYIKYKLMQGGDIDVADFEIAGEGEGHWVTINGAHVFLKD